MEDSSQWLKVACSSDWEPKNSSWDFKKGLKSLDCGVERLVTKANNPWHPAAQIAPKDPLGTLEF